MPLPLETHYTYKDYLSWVTEERYELFDGVAVLQARPSLLHQTVSGNIFFALRSFLDGKPCRAFQEIEVLLPSTANQKADDVNTVYIPDITVVCDADKLHPQYCLGAPDVVFEILSPSTARADRIVKLNAYQRAGVREYWLVSPLEETVQIFTLEAGTFHASDIFTPGMTATSCALSGFSLDVSKIFR